MVEAFQIHDALDDSSDRYKRLKICIQRQTEAKAKDGERLAETS